MVAAYQTAAAAVASGFKAMRAGFKGLNAALTYRNGFELEIENTGRRIYLDDHALNGHLDRLKRQTWEALIERLEIRQMLSVRRAQELDRQLRDDDWPEITEETVLVFVQGIQGQLDGMLEEAVRETFNWLRPRGARYKTNSQEEIRKKVILSCVLDVSFIKYSSRVYVHEFTRKHLTALENVFRLLDGKSTTKFHESELVSNLNRLSGVCETWRTETEYFRARACQNGNLHLEFKRLDLLARLNEIGGGSALRSPVSKKR